MTSFVDLEELHAYITYYGGRPGERGNGKVPKVLLTGRYEMYFAVEINFFLLFKSRTESSKESDGTGGE